MGATLRYRLIESLEIILTIEVREASFFKTSFSEGVATINVNSTNYTTMELDVFFQGSSEKSRLSAKLKKDEFLYEFQANSLETNFWSDYFVPFSGVKIRDDFLHIRGRLENKTADVNSVLPFFFHIDIDFDYLNVSIPKFSDSLVNTSGAVTFTNKNGTTLTFDKTFSNYKDVPIKIDGYINLSDKLIDLNLKNIDPVPNHSLSSNKIIQSVLKLNYILDVNYQVKGKLTKPDLRFNVDVNDIFVNDRSFQPLSFVIKDKRGHYSISSSTNSSIQVSGNVFNDSISLNISNFPFNFPSLSSQPFLDFDLKIMRDNELYSVQMDSFDDLSFSGFQFDRFNIFLIFKTRISLSFPHLIST